MNSRKFITVENHLDFDQGSRAREKSRFLKPATNGGINLHVAAHPILVTSFILQAAQNPKC